MKELKKPNILNIDNIARSRLFQIQSVNLEFSNGEKRTYERMKPANREAVMIVPIIDDNLILICHIFIYLSRHSENILVFL